MKSLNNMLNNPDVRGVVRTTNCEIIEFHSHGIKDLYNLLATSPNRLKGAYVADRVIGKGAALLLALGQVKQVFAKLISKQAVEVLRDAEIMVDYNTMVPNIINRDGTDICPIEKLTMTISQPDIAFVKIKEFISTK